LASRAAEELLHNTHSITSSARARAVLLEQDWGVNFSLAAHPRLEPSCN
jgi:hypothetical protein